MKRRSKILLFMAVGACVALSMLPYRSLLETKLKADIAAAGIEGVDFHVAAVGLHSITLHNVSMGGQVLDALTLGYTPLEIISGNFRTLAAGHMELRQGGMHVALDDVNLSITPDDAQKWHGPWQVKTIGLSGLPVDVPPLAAEGTMTREGERMTLQGTVQSADKAFSAAFTFTFAGENNPDSTLVLSAVKLPWNGGRLHVENVSVPLYGKDPITLKLGVQRVSLEVLMASATGQKATATGSISGSVPVTVARDGSFSLQAGNLKADGVGILTLAPELVPGDGSEVQLVRDLLKDFHYEIFNLTLENGDSKQLSMLLSVKGNNPEVYNGRQVNLNVHLSGNVIELLTQSVMMLQDPQQLLQQEHHE